jgi:hypothetical protein
MTEITAEDIHAFVALAQDEAAALHKLDGAAIKAFANAWPLIDQEVLSVRDMDDHELRQAIVEELLMAEDWRRGGKEMGYRAEDLVRFLPADLHARVLAAFSDPHLQSFLERRDDGEVRIDPAHLQDAMDYCGVWLEGVVPLTDDAVYTAGPGFR